MRYLLPMILLAACGDAPAKADKPRPNRVLLAISLVNPKAECYPVVTANESTPAPDTAYCAINTDVVFCKAPLTEPLQCQKIGSRQAEKPDAVVPPPVKAEEAKAK